MIPYEEGLERVYLPVNPMVRPKKLHQTRCATLFEDWGRGTRQEGRAKRKDLLKKIGQNMVRPGRSILCLV
jgi:hypothetical protein